MLTQLTIKHFATVDSLTLEYHSGFTAITGETGAGKSISIDALTFCLGGKADKSIIRENCDRADVSAQFLLDDTPSAIEWLKKSQLDEENECIIRRVINQDNRSKAFINGRAVTLTQLKELGLHLIQIHSQHESQRLLNSDYQQSLLDQYIGNPDLMASMKIAYQNWKNSDINYRQHIKKQEEIKAHAQLLQYQLNELNEFSPIEGEFEKIEEEYKKLSNNESLICSTQELIELIENNPEFNILALINQAKHHTSEIMNLDSSFNNVNLLLEEALVQIKEASYEIQNYLNHLIIDPERLNELNNRMSKQIMLARKHHIKPEQLPSLHQQLSEEYSALLTQEELTDTLKIEIEKNLKEMHTVANEIHHLRVKFAPILSQEITTLIQQLAMPQAQFKIEINWDENHISEYGGDKITFQAITNLGQSYQPIGKTASGGELSRIGLAIQVLTAQKIEMPALIFDEIDVGISGSTASKVGQLLQKLGHSTQVISVTHLPQVACYADQHYVANKKIDKQETKTEINQLTEEEKVQELARLLGGENITKITLANAKELLLKSSQR